MKQLSAIFLLIFLGLLGSVAGVGAAELETRFGKIIYTDQGALKKFNHELYLGSSLRNRLPRGDTLDGEVINKLEYVVKKVMLVLDMHLPELQFTIVIHPSASGVQADFKRLYHIDVDYIAFYSPHQNTVFYSAKDASLRVVAHEIGHVVAENYFQVSPPARIHEVMAQYAEKHVTD